MNKKMPAGTVLMIAVLLASGAVSSRAAASPKTTLESSSIIATVNGHPVTQDMFEEKLEQIYPSSSVHSRPGGTAELRQKALDSAILDELVWQELRQTGKVVSWEKAHQEMLRVRKLCGPKDFDAGLQSRGLTRDAYIHMLQRQLSIDAANKRRAAIPVKVSLAEARAFYDGNRQRFHRPDRVRIRLILAEVASNAKPEEEQAAKKKIDDIYTKLQGGADFAEMAAKYSDDEYRFFGGDVGWMHKGSMDKEFEPLAFSLPIGQITAPFRTPPGYSIMRVEEREPAKDLSFDEVRDKLIKDLTIQKSKKLQQSWEDSLKKNARIEIKQTVQPAQSPVAAAPTLTTMGMMPSH